MTAPHPPTEEHRLYLAARDMLGDPSPDTLLVVDFSGLAHIDDLTLWHAVAGGIRDRLGGEARDSFTLRHHRVALRLDGHRCADTHSRLDELAGFLAGHNHGRLTWRCFDLPRDGDGFLAFLRELKADGIAPAPPPPAPA
ncbi:MAG: hypothetical protein WD270_06510, partial [Acetobacterales bacterium]